MALCSRTGSKLLTGKGWKDFYGRAGRTSHIFDGIFTHPSHGFREKLVPRSEPSEIPLCLLPIDSHQTEQCYPCNLKDEDKLSWAESPVDEVYQATSTKAVLLIALFFF